MKKILVVDDHPVNREYLITLLHYRGYILFEASDGQEALAVAQQETPDLIITDIHMPSMDGIEFIERLRQDPILMGTKVIFYSATYYKTEMEAMAKRCGVTHCLVKPAEPQDVFKLIDELIGSQAQKPAEPNTRTIVDLAKRVLDLASANSRLAAIIELVHDMLPEQEVKVIFKMVCKAIPDLMATEHGCISTVENSASSPQFFFTQGIGEEQRTSLMNFIAQKSVFEGRESHVLSEEIISSTLPQFRSILMVPIATRKQIHGWLCCLNKIPSDEFSSEDKRMASTIATELTILYENVILYAETKRRNEELNQEMKKREEAEDTLRETNLKLLSALEELKAAQSKIIQQERLHALGTMAGGIVHDFNNALSPIVGFSDLILERPEHLENKEKMKHALEVINTAAKDASRMVGRLREFYRHHEADESFHPLDLNQLIETVISMTKPRWSDQARAAGITLSIRKNLQTIPPLLGIESELRELLTNLVFNAFDAMPEGGSLIFATRKQDDKIVLELRDTGIGMSDDVRRRCLEPFFTTKGEHGTGLGLSMVFGIVKRHGGDIDIESQVGEGTVFTLQFPTSRSKSSAPTRPASHKVSHKLSILLVEDEAQIRDVMIEYLIGDGHKVESASNGREGLEKFHAAEFDLVITDRGMPEIGGDRFAYLIQQITPGKPVIMLTGFGEIMEATEEKPDGVDLVISKPVTLSILREAISSVMQAVLKR